MNHKQSISFAILIHLFVLSVNGQIKTESEEREDNYETEEIYEEEYYDQEDDSYWLNQRRNELDKCADLIIYGDKKNANYFRIINEGKERYLYFDEVLVTTKNGELNAVYYPMLFRGERSKEISIHISKNFFNSDELKCRPQQIGSGNVTQDCIDLFPNNLLNENAFSHLEILKMEKDSKGKYATVSFQFYFADEDDFGNEISIQGVVNTNNIVDLSDSYQASTKNIKGENIEDDVNYLFYTEGGEAATLFSQGSYYGGQFREFLLSENQQLSSKNDLVLIEKFHPEFIQLNYYTAEVFGYDENRIFEFANHQHQKYVNPTLEKTITAVNPQKIRSIREVEIPPYEKADGNMGLDNQSLQWQQIKPTDRLIITPLQNNSNTYCPAPLEGFCIEEIIKSNGQMTDILIKSEYSENKSILDDFIDAFLLVEYNVPIKYPKYYEKNYMEGTEKGISNDLDSLLNIFKIPFKGKGDFFKQLSKANGSFQDVPILTNYFGYNQVQISFQKIAGNNQRFAELIKKWSADFEITKFYSDYLKIFETIDLENWYPNDFGNASSEIESMYETEAENYEYEEGFYEEDNYSQRENQENEIDNFNDIDETITKENNQKINNIVYNLFQKYGMEYDQNSEPETLQNLVFKNPNISERFGESSPYVLEKLIEFQEVNPMSEIYERYFPNVAKSPFEAQLLTIDSKSGSPVSRTFKKFDTEFNIRYELDSISIQSLNENQGRDQVTIPAPPFCYDIFSLTSLIAHYKIDKTLNRKIVLFDLVPEKSRSYSYSGSVELNLENEEADLEEIVPQIRNSINARPEFFEATITFDSKGTIGNNQAFYLLKVSVSGNKRNSILDYYTRDSAFYIQVTKSFPHYVLSIYN